MINCKTTQVWLMDYGDGVLPADRSAALREHLAACAECARAARDSSALRRVLGALEPVQTSPQFDAALRERLAHLKQPSPQTERCPWLPSLRRMPLLRPALALGAATCAIAGVLLLRPVSAPVTTTPPALDDSVFISQCVALHARDVAAQPLTDPASPGLAAGHSSWTGDTTADAASQDNL